MLRGSLILLFDAPIGLGVECGSTGSLQKIAEMRISFGVKPAAIIGIAWDSENVSNIYFNTTYNSEILLLNYDFRSFSINKNNYKPYEKHLIFFLKIIKSELTKVYI